MASRTPRTTHPELTDRCFSRIIEPSVDFKVISHRYRPRQSGSGEAAAPSAKGAAPSAMRSTFGEPQHLQRKALSGLLDHGDEANRDGPLLGDAVGGFRHDHDLL